MDDRTTAAAPPVLLTAAAIEALPEMPVGPTIAGVSHRVLWQTGDSMAGVMTVEGGHHLGGHEHRLNHHHMWILDGESVIMGERVGTGSYVHVPAGVHHDLDARDTEGCTLFYLYLRPPT